MSNEEVKDKLEYLGYSFMDVYRELKQFMNVSYHQVVRSSNCYVRSPTLKKVREQIEIQIKIWEHHAIR